MTTYETISLILSFGVFVLTLISLNVSIVKAFLGKK